MQDSSFFSSITVSLFLLLLLLVSCVPPSIDSGDVLGSTQSVFGDQNVPRLPTIEDLFSVSPITTSFDDAYLEAAQLDTMNFAEKEFVNLVSMPKINGSFLLMPGLYELEAESFCLRAGTYGPSEGDGYLSAPLKGDRRDIVHKILSTYANYPNVTQRQAQVLIWSIIARNQFTNMSPSLQATATTLLTPEELFELNGGAIGLIPDSAWGALHGQLPAEVRQVYTAERELRSALNQTNHTYESLEEIAVLAGVAPAEDLIRYVSRGRWAEHNDGYFIRYFPNGYTQTRVEVYVPSTIKLAQQGVGVGNISPVNIVPFNPSSLVATPANRSAQRLGIGTPQEEDLAFYEQLPDCPCDINQALPSHPGGRWGAYHPIPIGSLLLFHPGASTEIRWYQEGQIGPGQQCLYDSNGKLINQGLAAGTPDRVGFPDGANEGDPAYEAHRERDVLPFIAARYGDFWTVPLGWDTEDYLELWPPNQGRDEFGNVCPPNSGDSLYDAFVNHSTTTTFVNVSESLLNSITDKVKRDFRSNVGAGKALDFITDVLFGDISQFLPN